jgi:hypothetical protein
MCPEYSVTYVSGSSQFFTSYFSAKVDCGDFCGDSPQIFPVGKTSPVENSFVCTSGTDSNRLSLDQKSDARNRMQMI